MGHVGSSKHEPLVPFLFWSVDGVGHSLWLRMSLEGRQVTASRIKTNELVVNHERVTTLKLNPILISWE